MSLQSSNFFPGELSLRRNHMITLESLLRSIGRLMGGKFINVGSKFWRLHLKQIYEPFCSEPAWK